MGSTKRHESIIPLSRQHHHALMLCMRIHRGVPEHKKDLSWLETRAENAVRFFDSDLALHFKAEEEILFRAIRDFRGVAELLNVLLEEHRNIERLIEQLREIKGEQLARVLNEFADLLEAHIRKEERELFPLYESQVSAELAGRIGRKIFDLIGDAIQPKHPELLE